MWKNSHLLCCSLKQYLHIQNGFAEKIFAVLKVKPVNHCPIRYQNTTTTNSIQPRPHRVLRPSTVKYERPPGYQQPDKTNKKITPGEYTLLIIPLATFCLGTWQVYRRQWKIKIIENLESKMNEPPIELPDDLAELSELEYRKIKVKGKFDHSAEIYFGPRSLLINGESASKGGLISAGAPKTGGHHVITPFILSGSGKRILVNRGWVQTKSLLPSKRPEGQIEDEVELVGIVRLQETRGTFIPDNKPHLRVYHYRDLKKMAKKTDSLPVLLDATEESTVPGGPIGGQTNVSIRNEHMSYIITWYSLTAITSALWIMKILL